MNESLSHFHAHVPCLSLPLARLMKCAETSLKADADSASFAVDSTQPTRPLLSPQSKPATDAVAAINLSG